MCKKNLKTRDQIDSKHKWDIESMYPDEGTWDEDCGRAAALAEGFVRFSGRLGESPEALLAAFRERDELWLVAERAYVYARMKRDEDNKLAKYQAMSDKCQSLVAKAAAATSFFTPELLEIPESALFDFMSREDGLKLYEFAIMNTLRLKSHVLTKPEENIMAQYSEITGATGDIFAMLNNADIKFGTIKDEDGCEVELTHGRYVGFMESKDRRVRKESFEHMYTAYKNQINTIASAYNYNTKTDVVTARIRKYESSLHSALAGDNIPLSVYDNLISVVNQNLNTLHRYMSLRKRVLNLDELQMYDVYVPLIDVPKEDIPYETAASILEAGLAPLGPDYISKMKEGLSAGWVDVYENAGKTSGAYSFGSYDSKPFILLNYEGKLKDVFTLAHEMGHSMHSKYTRAAQPFIYGGHSIFTAEVASTVNESLLMKHLLSVEKNPDTKKYLLNMYIEEFRTTLFRQTMFAEFERATHQAAESGEALTAEWLSDEYGKLNQKYFGCDVATCGDIRCEWARIPHFYSAFYVYKYATGFSAAAAISDLILSGAGARDSYVEFLKSGESDHPIELLKIAGVDMSSPAPVELAMKTFENLIEEFEKLV
ncbi:MAG: oligoendopeptidase F [Clostridiales bacterium]|nr:oligoendopeptidase F [Clostridiales bacterium]